jgi:hypothetical protein
MSQNTKDLAGATSDAPQGKDSKPAELKADKGQVLEYEVFKIEEHEGNIHAFDVASGRLIVAAKADCKRLKSDGARYERLQVVRGKFEIVA